MSLKFENSSMHATPMVQALTCFALCAVDVFDFVPRISIFDCPNSPFSGSCDRGSRECVVAIGHPTAFHIPVTCRYRKRAPAYFLLNWKEALVAVTAHEGTHARQFFRRQRADEVACERAAFAALTLYREKQYELDEDVLVRKFGLDTLLSLPLECNSTLSVEENEKS